MRSPVPSWESGHVLRRLAVGLVAGAWALALAAWHRSFRFDDREAARLDAVLADGEPAIAVFWHGDFLPLLAGLSGRRALVTASRSFRGAIIAGIARRFGYATVQVDSRPHSTGDALVRALAAPGGLVAIAVDGPLGPRHVAKPGAVAIAARTGAWIVPVKAVASSRISLARRWDRLSVPLPFARVALRVGLPLRVDATDDLAAAAERVSRALLALDTPPPAGVDHGAR